MNDKFKLGDIIFYPLYDEGDLLVVSKEPTYYKVIGINGAVDGVRYRIPKDMQDYYEQIGNILKKEK